MNKSYTVRMSDEEQGICQEIVKNLQGPSQKIRRGQIRLKADAEGPRWPDVIIAATINGRVQMVENLRKRLVTAGLPGAGRGFVGDFVGGGNRTKSLAAQRHSELEFVRVRRVCAAPAPANKS